MAARSRFRGRSKTRSASPDQNPLLPSEGGAVDRGQVRYSAIRRPQSGTNCRGRPRARPAACVLRRPRRRPALATVDPKEIAFERRAKSVAGHHSRRPARPWLRLILTERDTDAQHVARGRWPGLRYAFSLKGRHELIA